MEVKKDIRKQDIKALNPAEQDAEKRRIREEMLKKRAAMSPDFREKAEMEIARLLFSCPSFRAAEKIFCYKSYNSEVGTDRIINESLRQGKQAAVPKVEGKRRMEFYFIHSLSELSPGKYGIPEPEGTPERRAFPDEKTLIILPGVAFDPSGARLGYGGGYYDTYLDLHREGKKAALAFEMQCVRAVPKEAHDIRADIVITENGIKTCRR